MNFKIATLGAPRETFRAAFRFDFETTSAFQMQDVVGQGEGIQPLTMA
jgi:hypothetical protein